MRSGRPTARSGSGLGRLDGFNLAETNLVVVSYSDTVERWLSAFRMQLDELPNAFSFIGTNSASRLSTDAERIPEASAIEEFDPKFRYPDDLAGIGRDITAAFERWSGSRNRTLLWFESLSMVLAHVDESPAFKFFHVLTRMNASVGGTGYYFIGEQQYNRSDVETFKLLFDNVSHPM